MSFFKSRKKELDSKSKAIARMYLDKAKFVLEKELATGERKGETEIWTANHDIKCLERAIDYLEQ